MKVHYTKLDQLSHFWSPGMAEHLWWVSRKWWLELDLCLACAVTPQSLPFRRFGAEVCFEVQDAVFYHCLEPAIFGQSSMYCYSKGERNPSVLRPVEFPQPLIGPVLLTPSHPLEWRCVLWWMICGVYWRTFFFFFLFLSCHWTHLHSNAACLYSMYNSSTRSVWMVLVKRVEL